MKRTDTRPIVGGGVISLVRIDDDADPGVYGYRETILTIHDSQYRQVDVIVLNGRSYIPEAR